MRMIIGNYLAQAGMRCQLDESRVHATDRNASFRHCSVVQITSAITLLVPCSTSEVWQPRWHVATSIGACARAGECAKCPMAQAPGITMTNVRDREGAHAVEVV